MTDKRLQSKPVQLSLFARATKNATWVARHLNTSPQTIARMIEDGTLEAYKLRDHGPWRIFIDSVAKVEDKIRARLGLHDGQKGYSK